MGTSDRILTREKQNTSVKNRAGRKTSGRLAKPIKTHPDKIGARNPYEYVNKILIKRGKKPVDWKKYAREWNEYHALTDPDEKIHRKNTIQNSIRKEFSKIFKKTDGTFFTFHELFDPAKHKSPLFVGVRYRDLNYIRDVSPKKNPPAARPGPEDYVADNQACSETIAGYGEYTPGSQFGIWTGGAGITNIHKHEYDDVVQGCMPDCWFLAALLSIAWTCPALLPSQARQTAPPQTPTPPGPDNAFSFVFYNDDRTPSYRYTYDDLLLAADGSLAGAKPNPNRAKLEFWMAIYEKAYGKYLLLPSLDGNSDHPDLSFFGAGDPLIAVKRLTPYTLQNEYSCSQNTADQIYNRILVSNSTGYIRQANGHMSWRTKYPAVAWTHQTESPEMVNAGLVYSSDAICANHGYALLGLFRKGNTGSRYIILRNPYGPGWFGDPVLPNPDDLATGLFSVSVNNQCAGTLAMSRNLEKSLCDDGTFGLKVEIFKLYFNKFGWMQP